MKSFKDYETLIRETVKEISDKDPNWNFSVKSIDENLVKIHWTYFKGDTLDSFYLEMIPPIDEDYDDVFITSRTPWGGMINGHFCHEDPSSQESYENGIKYAIYEIAGYAQTTY